MSVFEIRTMADFDNAAFHYESTKEGHLSLFARKPEDKEGTKRKIVLVLGSVKENNGLEVIETPDEVGKSTARDKQKLVLDVMRDDDIRKLTKLNTFAQQAFLAAFQRLPPNWFNTLSGKLVKVKIHPTETLISDYVEGANPEWKQVGNGLPAKPVNTKRKAEPPVEEVKRKRGRQEATVSGQIIKNDECVKKQGMIKMDATPLPETRHYVLFAKEMVVIKILVDGVWSATFDREKGESGGVVLVAEHIVRLRGASVAPVPEEIKLPSFDSF